MTSHASEADGAPARSLRVAVVGSGPAGMYAVQALLAAGRPVSVDVLDRLPAPYGLVRYGVAPDHVKMKSVIRVFHEAFEHDDVRFVGNVRVGVDLTRGDLHALYDAVVYATGAEGDRELGVPGEELPGSYGAAEFVQWYCAHPDAAGRDVRLDTQQVAVVGAGNVALDVARVLGKSADEMGVTEVPDPVLAALRASEVTDIHVLARRGPAQVKFTPVELRALGELANADVVVRPEEMVLDEAGEAAVAEQRQVRKNVDLLREWSQRPLAGRPRRVHFRFLRSPARILGEDRVRGIVLERNELTGSGSVRGTGEFETLDVGCVCRAVGYRGHALDGVPFDPSTATIPQNSGRVLDARGHVVPGEYVAGWAKRGPSGVIGTNKSDAAETVHSLLADADGAEPAPRPGPEALVELLARRGVDYVDWDGWLRLDTHEVELGQARGRARIKVPDRAAMLDLSRSAGAPADRVPGD